MTAIPPAKMAQAEASHIEEELEAQRVEAEEKAAQEFAERQERDKANFTEKLRDYMGDLIAVAVGQGKYSAQTDSYHGLLHAAQHQNVALSHALTTVKRELLDSGYSIQAATIRYEHPSRDPDDGSQYGGYYYPVLNISWESA